MKHALHHIKARIEEYACGGASLMEKFLRNGL